MKIKILFLILLFGLFLSIETNGQGLENIPLEWKQQDCLDINSGKNKQGTCFKWKESEKNLCKAGGQIKYAEYIIINGQGYCYKPELPPSVPTKGGQEIPVAPLLELSTNSIAPNRGLPGSTIIIYGRGLKCSDLILYAIEDKTTQTIPEPEGCNFNQLTAKIPSDVKLGQIINVQVKDPATDKISNAQTFIIWEPPTGTETATGTSGTSGTQKVGELGVKWPGSPLGDQLTNKSTVTDLIKYLYGWGISLGGFAAFIALVIAGVQYLTSAGNPGKMSEAISRIRSAGIGLVLLLSSVLILNTINPRLTQLKMPSLEKPESAEITVSKLPGLTDFFKDCAGAKLYSSPNGVGEFKTLYANESENSMIGLFTVGSVEILGGQCQLKLYQTLNFTENADRPATSISANTMSVASLGTTKFLSAKLINMFDSSLNQKCAICKK